MVGGGGVVGVRMYIKSNGKVVPIHTLKANGAVVV
jgi:hypothetical protein